MSDFHAGFFIENTDPAIHPAAFETLSKYCESRGYDKSRHALSWVSRRAMPFYLLIVTVDGMFAGRENEAWVVENRDLAGRLAEALECDVWAYTFNNQVGHETAVRYDNGGTVQETLGGEWDDGAYFIPTLAEKYNVPKSLLAHGLIYGTPSVSAPLDDHCDTNLLVDYSQQLLPVQRDETTGTPVRLFLSISMLDDMSRLASKRNCSIDDIVFDAWEIAKPLLADLKPPDYVWQDPPKLASRPLRLSYGDSADPPAMDQNIEKVSYEFHLDPDARSELHEFAVYHDRSNSWVLQKAYTAARSKLYAL